MRVWQCVQGLSMKTKERAEHHDRLRRCRIGIVCKDAETQRRGEL